MGNIPKYIYDQVDEMVRHTKRRKEEEIIAFYKPEYERIAEQILDDTIIIPTATFSTNTYGNISVSVTVKNEPNSYDLEKQIKDSTKHIDELVKNASRQLEDQYARWKLEVFTKSTDIYQSIPKFNITLQEV